MKKSGKKVITAKTKDLENIDSIGGILGKYMWIIIPLLTVIYFLISKYSPGFYQDDEIAQYLNAVKFKVNPFDILGNNPKPGWKIFIVIPALFNYQAVLLFNSFIAALCVFVTWKMLETYGIKFSYLGVLLLAAQPLLVDLSFRTYSEIFTALCLSTFLILYKKEYWILSGLLIGYVFTIRQEIAVFCIILGIIFLRRKNYLAFISIGIFPLIYNFLGFIKTGDLLFILSEMKSVASLAYNSQGIFHYFKVYIFIVGPVTLMFFLLGFFGFLSDTKNWKEYISKYFLHYLLFVTVFAIQIYTMWNNGPNPGNWRYLLHISPITVFFAMIGFNNLIETKSRKLFLWLSVILLFFTFVFLSKTTDGFKLLETTDYTKAIFIIITLGSVFLIPLKNDYLKNLSIFIIILSLIYTYIDFTPKQLSPENQTVKNIALQLNNPEYTDREVYSNHSVLFFFLDGYAKDPLKYKSVNTLNVKNAAVGSLVVWESHYGYRPEFNSDVKLESLQADTSLKLINQFTSLDRRFTAFIFEKIN